MKNAMVLITGWINSITDVFKALIALGVAIGILFNDPFNVIAGIGSLMSQFGDAGIAGLIAFSASFVFPIFTNFIDLLTLFICNFFFGEIKSYFLLKYFL